MAEQRRYVIPRWYYIVTPAFILLDYLVGVNVRVAVLDEMPTYKNLYYGFCIVCGVLVFLVPKASPVVAMFESTILFFATAASVILPCVENLERVADIEGDWKAAETFGVAGLTNLLLAGLIAFIGFRYSVEAVGRMSGFGRTNQKNAPPGPSQERADVP